MRRENQTDGKVGEDYNQGSVNLSVWGWSGWSSSNHSRS